MKIIAHRGASADYPELSSAAIAEAWRQDADGVELDLRLTRDGRLLLHHDETLRRRCGDPRRVRDLELRDCRVLNACRDRPDLPAEAPLLLEEALERIPSNRLALLELKEGPEQAQPMAQALAGRRDNLVLISFRFDTLGEVRRRLPDLTTLLLLDGRRPLSRRRLEQLKGELADSGHAGVGLNERLLDEGVSRVLKESGLVLACWTVDDVWRARQLAGWGVEWLTTNVPGRVRTGLANTSLQEG